MDRRRRRWTMFRQALGVTVTCGGPLARFWQAGRALVADRFRVGRMFLGGDAVHLFTPTGGMGYNTAIEDAVNLGWKLAAVLKRQASAALLDSYELSAAPSRCATPVLRAVLRIRLGSIGRRRRSNPTAQPATHARRRAGDYLANHARAEFNIPGIHVRCALRRLADHRARSARRPARRADRLCAEWQTRRPRAARLAVLTGGRCSIASASSGRCSISAPSNS